MIEDTNISSILETLARNQPRAPAIYAPGRQVLTYADLGWQIRYVRERLGKWGIGRGDFVVGVIPLRPEMAVACATLPAAATFAPLSPALTIDVYVELLTRLRPKALIVPKGTDHSVRLAARRCGVTELELLPDPSAPAGMFTLTMVWRDESLTRAGPAQPDWAYLLTTSGTTERAKLVPISHRRVASNAQHQGDWLRFTVNDVGCHVLPMHQSLGLNSGLIIPLLRGASVVCLPESDIDGFFAALTDYPITWLPAAFTHHREILRRASDFRETIARSELRCIRAGAGRLGSDEVDRIEQTFGAPLLTAYSMTEAYTITHEPLPPGIRKHGSVGVQLCNQVAIRTDAGNTCATGIVGEIFVRGPLVFEGYFDDAKATADAFVDGWFHTGDLGRFDEDSYLYLVGRIKDMINRGGEKISPVEIDAAIEAVSGVRSAATFAIPHQSLGEEVAAAIVKTCDADLDASYILDQVRRQMGPKRVPRKIYFVDRLPLTDLGKVRRSALPRLLGLERAETAASNESTGQTSTPKSPLEAALVGLWSSVLQGRSVGVNDDFFLLDGDSLQGARLLTSVKAVLGVEIAMPTLFGSAAPVAGMAREIEAECSANAIVSHE